MSKVRYAKDSHLIENKKAEEYASELFKFLFKKYDVGDYCFDVLDIHDISTNNGIKLCGETTEYNIYDVLSKFNDDGCEAAHYIIESRRIIIIEIYMWFDLKNGFQIFDLRKISKSLTKNFKQMVYQIIQNNYNEQ